MLFCLLKGDGDVRCLFGLGEQFSGSLCGLNILIIRTAYFAAKELYKFVELFCCTTTKETRCEICFELKNPTRSWINSKAFPCSQLPPAPLKKKRDRRGKLGFEGWPLPR